MIECSARFGKACRRLAMPKVVTLRSADGRFNRLPGLAAELVADPVAVIVALATQAATRARRSGDDDVKSASPLAKRNQRNEPQCYPCRDQLACREMAILFQHHRVWPSAVEARHPRRRARRPRWCHLGG